MPEFHSSSSAKAWTIPSGQCYVVAQRSARAAMVKYLEIMYEEMKVWTAQEKCRFEMDGDEYLYYSGQLPLSTSIANRAGGIVNTVGHVTSQLGTNTSWIGLSYHITNDIGLLTKHDGSISRVIHQFHEMYETWLDRQPWAECVIIYTLYQENQGVLSTCKIQCTPLANLAESMVDIKVTIGTMTDTFARGYRYIKGSERHFISHYPVLLYRRS
jgi:hypothetical protein